MKMNNNIFEIAKYPLILASKVAHLMNHKR